ncbi:uncharacterized protein LOC112269264 isoform X2 [Brachypodium distachyon]|nr:uncharacterized protein LOC112269264 isoform X2 [Brachypodium distachyon]XP_024311317.1 uncharacterized protein LOC112269264 isoform X2 [Brachypodium distachyon]|eukprot:XP_024311316.1 uncharacterized protein LOC112269264 isoform X2 [Brachypodium distachyon]
MDTNSSSNASAHTTMQIDATHEAPATEVISSDEEVRPAIRRRVDCVDEENDFGPIKVDDAEPIPDLGNTDFSGILNGDADHDLDDLANLHVDDYDLSSQAPVLTSQPPADRIVPPTADVSSDTPSSLQGEDKESSTQASVSHMDVSSLTQLYLKTTESALQSSFEGLNASDITEPQCHGLLRAMISVLPSVPQVASVREALEGIISTSTEVQTADTAIDSAPAKQSGAIAAATSEVQLLDDILRGTSNELSSMIEQQDKEEKLVNSLSAQLDAATLALHATREGVARLKLAHSIKQSEAKKLRDNLDEISSQAAREVDALKQKRSALMDEAGRFLQILKN